MLISNNNYTPSFQAKRGPLIDKNKVLDLYYSGLTIDKISKECKLLPAQVLKVLKDTGAEHNTAMKYAKNIQDITLRNIINRLQIPEETIKKNIIL